MISVLKKTAHAFAHALGWDVVRYSAHHSYRLRRVGVMKHLGIDLVADVGANSGQYAMEIRRDGFQGGLISFEPVRSSFEALCESCAGDPQWRAIRTAVGDFDGQIDICVAEDSTCSSVLAVSDELRRVHPAAMKVRTEAVPITRLDTIGDDLFRKYSRPWLKIDVQGYEKQVLDGLGVYVDRMLCFEVELSLRPLYRGESALEEMLEWLWSRGFELVSLGTGAVDQATGFTLQIDGIFMRRGSI